MINTEIIVKPQIRVFPCDTYEEAQKEWISELEEWLKAVRCPFKFSLEVRDMEVSK